MTQSTPAPTPPPTPEPISKPFEILPLLRADGPHPDHADDLHLFGQFVGVWQLDVSFFDRFGQLISKTPGEWSFSWVLDGRAIQDVLTMPGRGVPSGNIPGRRGIGTTLRYFDPKRKLWRIVWLGAVTGVLVTFAARAVDDEIWVDGGTSWWPQQAMVARRKINLNGLAGTPS